MTYKIDEHTEFWGGKQLPQTVKQGVADYPPDDGHLTPEQLKAIAVANTSTTDLRKQLDAWPSSQNNAASTFVLNTETSQKLASMDKAAVKHDTGKPDWSLVPFESLEGMVKVLEFGAQKYAGWNWTTNGGFPYMRVMRSCLRHLFAWSRGEDIDPESGLSHIHHAMCNLLFISHYIGNKEKYNKDDRQVR